ncbi:fun domain protein [Neisseria polysaccharea]|uniref:fun domain protein n=1 Tax=Neisseria polysaccharea TaxID=489 RepID=UPI00272D498E|nr:fun domain protein [Neisseria polysaccharea]
MKFINELSFGFPDAENYKRKENKGLFNKIFIKDDYLQKILNPSTSFLIGEKGTGKQPMPFFYQITTTKIIFPA